MRRSIYSIIFLLLLLNRYFTGNGCLVIFFVDNWHGQLMQF